MYECELCNEVYREREDAHACESKGSEIPLVKIDDMVDYEVKVGGGFNSFYVPLRVTDVEDRGHYIVYYFEQYDEDENEWSESDFAMSGVWGNEKFEELCTIK